MKFSHYKYNPGTSYYFSGQLLAFTFTYSQANCLSAETHAPAEAKGDPYGMFNADLPITLSQQQCLLPVHQQDPSLTTGICPPQKEKAA